MVVLVVKVVRQVVRALSVVMELNQLVPLELRQQALRLAHVRLRVDVREVCILQYENEVLGSIQLALHLLRQSKVLLVHLEDSVNRCVQPVKAAP